MFDGRTQLPMPDEAKEILKAIPATFYDDGCSGSPDSWFGFNFKWACRIHDWRGCSRCHAPGSRTLQAMWAANEELKKFISMSLPFRWRWLQYAYYFFVVRFNGDVAWDSCGAEAGERCRHGQPKPDWMSIG